MNTLFSRRNYALILAVFYLITPRRYLIHVEACDHGHHHGQLRKTTEGNDSFENTTSVVRSLLSEDRNRFLQDGIVEECWFQEPSSLDRMIDDELMKRWKERQGEIEGRATSTYRIPTYFHIIQPDSSNSWVSDSRVDEYIEYINDAHAGSNSPFVFELKGITRTINAAWSNDGLEYELDYKGALKVGRSETLNVYICKSLPANGGYYAGFSYTPDSNTDTFTRDGVVLARSTSDRRLNTFVHEVGHYLGLYHTFGNTCTSTADRVDDTPAHLLDTSNINCFTSPDTWDSCPQQAGKDPVDNYMTYSPDNFCRTEFTQGQVERMVAQFELYRLDAEIHFREQSPSPTPEPTRRPTPKPTRRPTPEPTRRKTTKPTRSPTPKPTVRPTSAPKTNIPTPEPTTPTPTSKPSTRSPTVSRIPFTKPPAIGIPIFPWPTPVEPTGTPTMEPITAEPTTSFAPTISPAPTREPTSTRPPAILPACYLVFSRCESDDYCCSGRCGMLFGTISRCGFSPFRR